MNARVSAHRGVNRARADLRGWATVVAGVRPPRRSLARINHPFLNKFFFTERTEFRTELTEPNPFSAL